MIFDDVTKDGHTPTTVASSEIKGRGSDFATATKRSYKLKLGEKVKPFSLNEKKSKHFTLIPYEQDAAYGLLSNYAGHRIAEAIGMEWAPAMMPVELVVNGSYYGLYFLGENIRVADDRLNIADDETDGYAAGDTWIWEVDVNGQADAYGYSWNSDNAHWIVSQMPELADYSSETPDESPTGKKITWNEINTAMPKAVNALACAAANAAGAMYNYDWQSTIDTDEAAMFMIVNELMDCSDAFATNFYMWYSEGQWKLGPVWGFNNSFASADGGKSQLTIDRTDYNGVLVQDLYKNALFRSRLTTLFQYFIHDFSEDSTDDTSATTARRPQAVTAGVDDTSALATALADVVALAKTMETAATYDATAWPTVAATSDNATVTDRANALASTVKANALWLESDPGTSGYDGAGWNWDTLGQTTGVQNVLQGADDPQNVRYFDVMGRQLPSAPSTGVYIELRGNKSSIRY